MWIWLSIAAAVAVVFLCWSLYRHFASSRIGALMNRRRATSRMVSTGEFVDGNRHLPVALALTNTELFYENSAMQASLDLRWVREIEYDTNLSSGPAIESGKVLRIRSFSQVFEFVIPDDVVTRWHMILPPRQNQEAVPGGELAMRVATAT